MQLQDIIEGTQEGSVLSNGRTLKAAEEVAVSNLVDWSWKAQVDMAVAEYTGDLEHHSAKFLIAGRVRATFVRHLNGLNMVDQEFVKTHFDRYETTHYTETEYDVFEVYYDDNGKVIHEEFVGTETTTKVDRVEVEEVVTKVERVVEKVYKEPAFKAFNKLVGRTKKILRNQGVFGDQLEKTIQARKPKLRKKTGMYDKYSVMGYCKPPSKTDRCLCDKCGEARELWGMLLGGVNEAIEKRLAPKTTKRPMREVLAQKYEGRVKEAYRRVKRARANNKAKKERNNAARVDAILASLKKK